MENVPGFGGRKKMANAVDAVASARDKINKRIISFLQHEKKRLE